LFRSCERRESFVSAASTRNLFTFANAERAAPGSPIWPCTRWGLPCLVACASSGGLLHHLFTLTGILANPGGIFSVALSVGTPHGVTSRVYLRQNRSYAASRPVEFGLSSPGLRQKRFSAFPKPSLLYQGNQEEQRWKIPSSKLQHPEKFQPSNTNTARRLIIEASLELGIWNLELSQRPLNPYPLNNKECARN
jgi:hypothetical protein